MDLIDIIVLLLTGLRRTGRIDARSNWKTYAACVEDGLKVGWRSSENTWYCNSLGLK